MKGLYSILLLICSNVFMTFAWYGHLKLKELPMAQNWGIFIFIVLSWAIAFFEYCCQVPANRIGFSGNGGPFSLVQLKVIQEAINLVIFMIFTLLFFKTETFKLNHLIGFAFLILAVFFIFKK